MKTQTQRKGLDTAVSDSLRHRRRRLALAVSYSYVYPISETDLAAQMVAKTEGKPLVEVTETEHRRVLVSLHHEHLPKLADAGLIERDPETRTVRATDHPALRDPGIQRVIDATLDGEDLDFDLDLDATFDALANARRRLTLSVLVEARQPLSRRALARRVAARKQGRQPETVPDEALEETMISLEHVHLPKLRQAGLVEGDGEGALTYDGHPALRRQWFDPGV